MTSLWVCRMCLAVMPTRKSARSSSPMVPVPEAAAPEPTVDLTHLKILLELLIKSAASQQGPGYDNTGENAEY